MAEENVVFNYSANVAEFNKGVGDVVKGLASISSASDTATNSILSAFNQMAGSVNGVNTSISSLQGAFQNAGNTLNSAMTQITTNVQGMTGIFQAFTKTATKALASLTGATDKASQSTDNLGDATQQSQQQGTQYANQLRENLQSDTNAVKTLTNGMQENINTAYNMSKAATTTTGSKDISKQIAARYNSAFKSMQAEMAAQKAQIASLTMALENLNVTTSNTTRTVERYNKKGQLIGTTRIQTDGTRTLTKQMDALNLAQTRAERSALLLARTQQAKSATALNEMRAKILAAKNEAKQSTSIIDKFRDSLQKMGAAGSSSFSQARSGADKMRNVLDKLYRTVLRVSTVIYSSKQLSNAISGSMSYIETVNLFNVTMGDAAEKAEQFQIAMSDALGLDPVNLMKMQGRFDVLAKSIGVTSGKAYTLSQGLTQVSVDLASLWDMDVEEVTSKLESGIVGYSRAVRDLGIDVSLNALENEMMLLGLKGNVRTLDQATKMQLRYSAIMRQSSVAQGDFARTMMQPANQLRILKEQIVVAARSIGNSLLPMIAQIIPWLIAFAKFVAQAFASLANFLGFSSILNQAKENAQTASGSVKILGDDYDDLSDSIGGTTEAVKDLLSVQGFDELNKLTPDKQGGGGAGAGNGGLKLDVPIESYNMGFSELIGRADEFLQKIKEIWDEFRQSDFAINTLAILKNAWDLVKDAAIFAWNIIKGVVQFIADNSDWALPVLIGAAVFSTVQGWVFTAITGIIASLSMLIAHPVIGGIALVVAAVAGIAAAAALAPDEFDKLNGALDAHLSKVTPFVDEYNKATGAITDVNKIISSNGKTLAGVDKEIADTEAKITKALQEAYTAQGKERAKDLEDARVYIEKLRVLEQQKLDIYRLNAEATFENVQWLLKNRSNLSQTELADMLKSLDNADAELKKQREKAKESELAQLRSYYKAKGMLTSAEYDEEQQYIQNKYKSQQDIDAKAYSQNVSALLNYMSERRGIIDNANKEAISIESRYLAEKDRINNELLALERNWQQSSGEYMLTYTADKIKLQEQLNTNEKKFAEDYKKILNQRNADEDNAFVSAVAIATSRGLELTDENEKILADILTAWTPLSPGLEKSAKEGLLKLSEGLKDKPGFEKLKEASKMTSDQILATIRAGMGVNADGTYNQNGGTYQIGKNAILGFAKGVLDAEGHAVTAVKVVGNTVVKAFGGMLEVHSPSRVFADIGMNTMKGFVLGVKSMVPTIEKTFESMPIPDYSTTYALMYGSAGSYTTPPMQYDRKTASSAPQITEDMLYRAFSRATREMPTPILNMEGDTVARTVNELNDLQNRRYNTW